MNKERIQGVPFGITDYAENSAELCIVNYENTEGGKKMHSNLRNLEVRQLAGLFFLFSMVYSMSLSGCSRKIEEAGGKKGIEKAVAVKAARVKRGNINKFISLTGEIHGQKEVNVYTKVPGKLIEKIKNEGDRVKKGQVVALIDRDEEALKFSEAEVKSPINGVVTMYFADLGEAVFPAQPMPREPVATIADMDKVKVLVHLSEPDIGKVKKGQPAEIRVDSYSDRVFKGIVTSVAPAVNPITRKLKVEITIPNPGHILKPGMFARVKIIIREFKNVLLVPRLAVLERKGKKIVFTCENNRAEITNVLTGAEDGKNIEIKEGLKEGDKVIVEGNYALLEGTRVKAVETDQ